jgi:hypothetical protein
MRAERPLARRRHRAASRSVCAGAVLLAAASASADVVFLQNGNQLEGQVSRTANGDIEILSAAGSLRLPPHMVVRVESAITVEQRAVEELAGLPSHDVEGRLQVARQLEAEGAGTLAREVYRQIVALSPDHAAARRALGEVDCDGQWLSEETCHRQRGEVLHRGQWISSEQWARLEALEISRRQAEIDRLRAEAQRQAMWIEERSRLSQQETYGYGSFGWWGGAWLPRPPHHRPRPEPRERAPKPRPQPTGGGSSPPRRLGLSPGQPPFTGLSGTGTR